MKCGMDNVDEAIADAKYNARTNANLQHVRFFLVQLINGYSVGQENYRPDVICWTTRTGLEPGFIRTVLKSNQRLFIHL